MNKSFTRKKILDESIELFSELGFSKASIRDLVRAVGVTNSTVYVHFKNKDEILFSIIENIAAVLRTELDAAIEKQDDPVECLRDMIFRQVYLIKERRKEIKIYIEEQNHLPAGLRKKVLKQHRELYNLYFNKILEIKGKGLAREIDPVVMTFGIFAMMNWAYRWFKDDGRLSIEQIAEGITHLFFEGILTRDSLADPEKNAS
ncbi:MAG: TetR family transcriptional regulator [Thermodesulfobacteriota bacterium]|nr:TetR family transcriptional regulator [Thermodesulfobacteriota bacterium]